MAGSIWDRAEYKGLAGQFDRRRQRYGAFWRYYKATIYDKAERGGYDFDKLREAAAAYTAGRFEAAIRPLFTPLARAVNIDVSLIPAGWRLAAESADLAPVVAAVFEAWQWSLASDIYTRFFSAMGEAGLYVVDLGDGRIGLNVLRPDQYIVEHASRHDRTPARLVIVMAAAGEAGETIEEAIVIEPATVRTYRGGELAPLDGRPAAEYENVLGFVPIVTACNDPGDGEGEPTFDDVLPSIDEMNGQATHLAEIIKRHVEPQWAAFGAEAGDLEKSGDTVWFFPEGSDVKAILAAVDFEGFLAFIKELKEEIKEGLPELALSRLVGIERVAAATIELQMSEAVYKVRRLRRIADYGLAAALMMAGRVAAQLAAAGELAAEAATWPALAASGLQFDDKRPVITADILTQLQIGQAEAALELQRLALAREQLLEQDEAAPIMAGDNGR